MKKVDRARKQRHAKLNKAFIMRMDMIQGVLNTDERGAGIVKVRQRIEQRIEPKENEVLEYIRKI